MPGLDSFTKLLLHCDGLNGSTVFTDSSLVPHTVAANGNAQISTALSKFGGSCGLFDGTGDYLSIDGSADFAFGTGDWTIDFWLRLGAIGIFQFVYDGRPAAGAGAYLSPYVNSSNVLVYHTDSLDRITGTTALTVGVWNHVAFARAAGSTRMFLNGAQEGSTYTDANVYLNAAGIRPLIGASAFDLSSPLNGRLDEYRISKGVARWRANFTPDTVPYSVDELRPMSLT